MSKQIDDKLAKIEERKKKLQLKEKLLKEKEKQKRARRFSDIGRIAYKADIDTFEDDILYGAFLELSSKASDEKKKEWEESGKSHASKQSSDSTPLSITFENVPSSVTKKMLKELGFRWNKFRKEFCGFGDQLEIEKSLSGEKYRIEVLD